MFWLVLSHTLSVRTYSELTLGGGITLPHLVMYRLASLDGFTYSTFQACHGLQSWSFSLDTLLFCFCFYAIVRSSHDFVTRPKAVPITLNTRFLIVISMTETLAFVFCYIANEHQFF